MYNIVSLSQRVDESIGTPLCISVRQDREREQDWVARKAGDKKFSMSTIASLSVVDSGVLHSGGLSNEEDIE